MKYDEHEIERDEYMDSVALIGARHMITLSVLDMGEHAGKLMIELTTYGKRGGIKSRASVKINRGIAGMIGRLLVGFDETGKLAENE